MPEEKKHFVIIDSNILQYLNNKEKAPEILNYFTEITKAGFTLAISEISIFELLSGIPRKNENQYIAATATLINSLILTADSNDFPRPFFKEFHKKFIFFKEKNKDRMLSIYLLQPDLEQINFRFNERK